MAGGRKTLINTGIFILLFAAGLVFLIRGCLSKYDSRFAMPPALYFEENGKTVVFSIVQLQNTTSYSSKGGVTRRSIDVEYSIQCNDASTGTKVNSVAIAEHEDIKEHPVEVLGAAHNRAWAFISELMAFDPFTLEKVADASILQQKNPQLNGKLPAERTYYVFNRADGNILITAKDGSKWVLDTKTLTAKESTQDAGSSPLEAEVKRLEALAEHYHRQRDSVFSAPSKLLSEKKISSREYMALRDESYKQRKVFEHLHDSVQAAAKMLEDKQGGFEDLQREIKSLQRWSVSYSQIKTNSDTVNGIWYGLYSGQEMEKLYDRVRYQSENDETARRQLFTTTFGTAPHGDLVIDKSNSKTVSSEPFLHGGFLLDKQTAMPIRAGNSFLVVHKDQLGKEGKILISKLDFDGKVSWSVNSGLKEWGDWIFNGKQLVVLGTGHESLTGGQCNIMLIIDLATGKEVRYDYMSEI